MTGTPLLARLDVSAILWHRANAFPVDLSRTVGCAHVCACARACERVFIRNGQCRSHIQRRLHAARAELDLEPDVDLWLHASQLA